MNILTAQRGNATKGKWFSAIRDFRDVWGKYKIGGNVTNKNYHITEKYNLGLGKAKTKLYDNLETGNIFLLLKRLK